MKPIYDGYENHYKKMLDLQEKLRRSEEERIRLEERFNLLVQESRNRHQACINRLRIRYVEFLEEQKARDERNNRILVALDKVDNSLTVMSAKTDRLNTLRKQYEAYLLRTYGNQRLNGSVTADSGLESQNDQEIPPSPVFSKSLQAIPKVVFPYANQEIAASNYKAPNLDNQSPQKLVAENPTEPRRNSTFKPPPAASSPLLCDDPSSILRNRFLLSPYVSSPLKYSSSPKLDSYLDNSFRYTSTPKPPEIRKEDLLKSSFSKSIDLSPEHTCDLDSYIDRIKRLNTEFRQERNKQQEHSFEDADYEQNTSGDLLNVTLSDDGLEPSEEEQGRVRRARQAFARNTRISTIDKFSQQQQQPEIAAREIKQQPAAIEDALAKLASLDETRRLMQQQQQQQQSVEQPTDERETRVLADEPELPADHETKDDNDGIEDDYDESVDIESWMPDDVEEREERTETRLHDEMMDRTRRKLESIEEVELTEDEEPEVEKPKEEEEAKVVEEEKQEAKPVADEKEEEEELEEEEEDEEEREIKELEKLRDSQERQLQEQLKQSQLQEQLQQAQQSQPAQQLPESKEDEAKDQKETYDNNQKYADDQQYYQTDADAPQQYQENAEYYEQQQGEEQQPYQYSEDPNQQYAYDPNAQYDYENQQYTDGQYADYNQYQYDPNQPYEHDPNQQYQYGAEYEAYQNMQGEQRYPEQTADQNQYDPNQAYDYSQQPEAYGQEDALQSGEAYGTQQELPVDNYAEQQAAKTGPARQESKESTEDKSKKKKDVIKSILDSDTDSFIERNLSNTESDFDFN